MGTKDYIDTVVLTEKPQEVEAARKPPIGTNQYIAVVNDARLTRVGDVEVTALTIDESSSDDGDPYNSTGKHCVVKTAR